MRIVLALAAVPLLAACVSLPSGPSVMVLPGSSKSFDQFRADDMDCRQFASNQVGGTTPDGAAENSAVKSAVIGTAIGAAAGALFGGHGNPVATGAGVGLVAGSAMGAGAGSQSQYELQRRYDYGYQQCMFARGHQIPGVRSSDNGYSRRQAAPYARPAAPPPPPGASAPGTSAGAIPPPPPGAPPPPPPGVTN